VAMPALRVQGPYLAMVTIAFGFIVEHGTVEWRGLTAGGNGLLYIPAPVPRSQAGGAAYHSVPPVRPGRRPGWGTVRRPDRLHQSKYLFVLSIDPVLSCRPLWWGGN